MKKIILLALIPVFLLAACGEETEQEKAQKKAAVEGFNILKDLGKMAQEGSSDQELQNTALDRIAESLGKVVEGSEAELTDEEKQALKDGASLLKDGAKGLKDEALKALRTQD